MGPTSCEMHRSLSCPERRKKTKEKKEWEPPHARHCARYHAALTGENRRNKKNKWNPPHARYSARYLALKDEKRQ